MKVGYYMKGSKTGEVITIKEFNTMSEAIETFAGLKNLPVVDFLNLFSVTAIVD
jgi:hypothetical protein|tara:strand:+ start:212 stop:373 length:162 start_codon:yes stop_codon:yes gene_type:complete